MYKSHMIYRIAGTVKVQEVAATSRQSRVITKQTFATYAALTRIISEINIPKSSWWIPSRHMMTRQRRSEVLGRPTRG
jgi:hypothetical protein